MADKTLTVRFELERETKNKVRFAEVVAKDATPVIGTLYIDKGHLETLGDPENLTVRIAAPK